MHCVGEPTLVCRQLNPGSRQGSMTIDDSTIAQYIAEGEQAAGDLGNRGPLRFEADGTLPAPVIDAYTRCGFYVFEGFLEAEELADLQRDVTAVLERAPHTEGAAADSRGRPAIGAGFARPTFRFARPLSDPVGGTMHNKGRHPVRMTEYEPPADAPDLVISSIGGPLQVVESCLRLYGHPHLLRVAEQINGPDCTPFNEALIVKRPGLGSSVAWHQDGTSQWNRPDWDEGTHGFNFMAQLFGSTAANGVWVLPRSHKRGKIDIAALVAANGGNDRLPGAVPMVCVPGDVVVANRQVLHASFPNTSDKLRVTFNFGFHRRSSVLGAECGGESAHDEARVFERSRVIALAIDARCQRYPHEQRYTYQPMAGREESNRWTEASRETILKDYNTRDLGL